MNSKTTIIGLVAAIAVLSGAMGLSVTGGAFSDVKVAQSTIPATGFLMGHVEIEAKNADGELIAYRQTDNEVVDGGEQCILKMLFATSGVTNSGRGEYASTTACTGILTGAWDVIAVGTGTTDIATVPLHDVYSGLEKELIADDMERAISTTKTWTNGSADSPTKIELKNTFTSTATHSVTESGLFNSTAVSSGGMLAHQTFTAVSLTSGDSITVTWTFTVGN